MEIDKVAWIRISDKKLLSTRSKGKNVLYIPGGKREKDESDADTLTREIFEELDVQIIPSSIKYFGTFVAQADGHEAGIDVKMTCYNADFIGEISPSSEISEVLWVGYEDKMRCSPVDQLILDHLYKRNLIS